MKNLVKPYQSLYSLGQKIFDFILPMMTLYITSMVYNKFWNEKYAVFAILAGVLFVFFSRFYQCYSGWRGASIFVGLRGFAKSWSLAWFCVIAILFMLKESHHVSRVVIVAWLLLTHVLIIIYKINLRWFVGKLRTLDYGIRTVAFAGAGQLSTEVAKVFMQNPWLGVRVYSFYDDNAELENQKLLGVTIRGNLEKLVEDAMARKFNEVYIALPLYADSRIKYLLSQLSNTPCRVKFVPDIFAFELLQSKWFDVGGIPVFSVYDSPLDGLGKIMKRFEDIILSFAIILFISPALVLIALGVRFTSKGPIIFRQKRYGMDGKEFWVWKFRTMKVCEEDGEIVQATQNDVRVTPFGSFLRRNSLDELPQFFNVLTGQMSVVGPRPHAKYHDDYYSKLIPGYSQRHLIKPGLTGWAQINGYRGETNTLEKMEKRIQFDIDYIRRWSIWFDLKIVFLTIFKGFNSKNAY